ncbi:MAG: hypothetical protein ACYDCH_13400 [Gaiellaceae bacterium]
MATVEVKETWPTRVVSQFEGITDERVSQDEALYAMLRQRPLPIQLIRQYAQLATRHAQLRRDEDGDWYAEIEGFAGVWAKEATPQETFKVLEDVVFEWVLLKIRDEDRDIPVLESLDLNAL